MSSPDPSSDNWDFICNYMWDYLFERVEKAIMKENFYRPSLWWNDKHDDMRVYRLIARDHDVNLLYIIEQVNRKKIKELGITKENIDG